MTLTEIFFYRTGETQQIQSHSALLYTVKSVKVLNSNCSHFTFVGSYLINLLLIAVIEVVILVQLQCLPVYSMLLALRNPTVHFFVLDIEGFELAVLRTIPFHKVDIEVSISLTSEATLSVSLCLFFSLSLSFYLSLSLSLSLFLSLSIYLFIYLSLLFFSLSSSTSWI